MTSDRRLQLEAQAAAILKSALLEITDDDVAVQDTIEGETNLQGAIEAVLSDILQDQILIDGIDKLQDSLATRKNRLENRTERRRRAIGRAMEVGEIKTLPLSAATLSLRNVPPGLDIVDEKLIPESFFIPQPPKLDRTALKEALKAGKQVSGATLGNGSVSLSVRKT